MPRLNKKQCPINGVPDDILIYVFSMLSERSEVFDRAAFLWQGLRVCHRWHDILTSTPTLWSNLSFNLPIEEYYSPENYRRVLNSTTFVETVLRRSASCELTIYLSIIADLSFTGPFCSPINEESHRWKKLTIHSPSVSYAMDYIAEWDSLGLDLDTLTHIALSIPSQSAPSYYRNCNFPSILFSAPLQSISLDGLNQHMLPTADSLSWDGLLSYRGTLYHPGHLTFAKNLRSYEVRFRERNTLPNTHIEEYLEFPYRLDPHVEPTRHLALEELITDNAFVFQDYVFPNLQRLSYYVREHDEGLAFMARMLERAQPPLQVLYVALDIADPDEFDALLRALPLSVPRLRSLRFRLRGEAGVQALGPILTTLASGTYLPCLEEVRLWAASNSLHKEENWQVCLGDVADAHRDALRVLDVIFVPESHRRPFPEEDLVEYIPVEVAEKVKAAGARIHVTVKANGRSTRIV